MTGFRGICVPIVTPFDEHGEVDADVIRSNVEFLIDHGVHGIIPTGSTGEFASLSREERMNVIKLTIDSVNGRVPVIAGTSAQSTRDATEYSKFAEDSGADGVMMISPFYGRPRDAEVVEHYKTVARSIHIPIMIYNNPGTSGVDLKPVQIAEMSRVDNISYVKDSTGSTERVHEIIRLCGERITVFCGWDSIALESFLLGCKGWVAGVANVVPKQCVELFNLAVNKMDMKAARDLYYALLPLLQGLEAGGAYAQYVKACMELLGRDPGKPRRPLLPPTEEEREMLRELLSKVPP